MSQTCATPDAEQRLWRTVTRKKYQLRRAATFPSGEQLVSWVGACPGDEESAGVNYSHRSLKGNRHSRRLLNQAANAAVKSKEVSSRLSIVVASRALDIIKPSESLRIDSV